MFTILINSAKQMDCFLSSSPSSSLANGVSEECCSTCNIQSCRHRHHHHYHYHHHHHHHHQWCDNKDTRFKWYSHDTCTLYILMLSVDNFKQNNDKMRTHVAWWLTMNLILNTSENVNYLYRLKTMKNRCGVFVLPHFGIKCLQDLSIQL